MQRLAYATLVCSSPLSSPNSSLLLTSPSLSSVTPTMLALTTTRLASLFVTTSVILHFLLLAHGGMTVVTAAKSQRGDPRYIQTATGTRKDIASGRVRDHFLAGWRVVVVQIFRRHWFSSAHAEQNGPSHGDESDDACGSLVWVQPVWLNMSVVTAFVGSLCRQGHKL